MVPRDAGCRATENMNGTNGLDLTLWNVQTQGHTLPHQDARHTYQQDKYVHVQGVRMHT